MQQFLVLVLSAGYSRGSNEAYSGYIYPLTPNVNSYDSM